MLFELSILELNGTWRLIAMNHDNDPLAYLITWTVYGTHLQGSTKGWRRRRGHIRPPARLLENWRRSRLNHAVIPLSPEMRSCVESQIERHCDHRGWRLWARNARTTHVHAAISARDINGRVIRDQLKAYCTRGLRERWDFFQNRPVWTELGDWRCLNSEEALAAAIAYIRNAQDLKYKDVE